MCLRNPSRFFPIGIHSDYIEVGEVPVFLLIAFRIRYAGVAVLDDRIASLEFAGIHGLFRPDPRDPLVPQLRHFCSFRLVCVNFNIILQILAEVTPKINILDEPKHLMFVHSKCARLREMFCSKAPWSRSECIE